MSNEKDRDSKPKNKSSQKTPLERALEGILERLGNGIDEIAQALNPRQPQPVPIPIPVPVYRRRRRNY